MPPYHSPEAARRDYHGLACLSQRGKAAPRVATCVSGWLAGQDGLTGARKHRAEGLNRKREARLDPMQTVDQRAIGRRPSSWLLELWPLRVSNVDVAALRRLRRNARGGTLQGQDRFRG